MHQSRRRDTSKIALMTHGNAAGAIVRYSYWPPHSTSYVASSYGSTCTCDTLLQVQYVAMAVPSPAGPMRWSIGPCHRIASVGGRSIRSPKRKDTVFIAKINFSAPHCSTTKQSLTRPLHASFFLHQFINNNGRRLLSPAHHDPGHPFVLW